MQSIFFGFLLGLAVHIRFHTKVGHAELGGVLVALIVQALWGLA